MPKCSECTREARAKGLCREMYEQMIRGTFLPSSDGRYQDVYYPCDPSLLPDDGHIDATAVDIAAGGTRLVRLTNTEREHAARRILADGGTVETIQLYLDVTERVARRLAIQPVKEVLSPAGGGPVHAEAA